VSSARGIDEAATTAEKGAKDGTAPPAQSLAGLLRSELADISAYHPHPGDYAVRLDANEAPDFWSEAARARLGAASVAASPSRYPDTRALELKEAIAKRVGARTEELMVGVGSDEVIALLLTALDRPRERGRPPTMVTITPSFVMYRISSRVRGFSPVEVPLDASWQLPVASMVRAVEAADPNLVFLPSPNNPTGNAFPEEDVRRVVEAAPRALVVLDEAYAAYSSVGLSALFDTYPNVALLGTLSKIGLAALRVGWLRGNPSLVAEIDKVRQPYNMPAVCQRMATVALTELSGEIDAAVALVRRERARLTEELTGLGFVVTPSEANFLWVKTPVPAGELFVSLGEKGVLVRSFHDRGGRLGSQLRVTVGTPAENDRFLEAVRASL
jgi:histidinol-phosphate aminotransferase